MTSMDVDIDMYQDGVADIAKWHNKKLSTKMYC
jgi:hypothetical protein